MKFKHVLRAFTLAAFSILLLVFAHELLTDRLRIAAEVVAHFGIAISFLWFLGGFMKDLLGDTKVGGKKVRKRSSLRAILLIITAIFILTLVSLVHFSENRASFVPLLHVVLAILLVLAIIWFGGNMVFGVLRDRGQSGSGEPILEEKEGDLVDLDGDFEDFEGEDEPLCGNCEQGPKDCTCFIPMFPEEED